MFLYVLIQVWASSGHRDIRQRPQFSMMMMLCVMCNYCVHRVDEVHLGIQFSSDVVKLRTKSWGQDQCVNGQGLGLDLRGQGHNSRGKGQVL